MKCYRNKSSKLTLAPILFIALSLTLTLSDRAGATDVSGPITENTTWHPANSPFNVVGPVTVNAGVTLLIASGVEVSVPPGPGGGSTIEVYGVLNAAGANLHGVVSTWGNQQLAIVVRSGGEADLSECTLSLAALQYDSGSTGTVENCTGSNWSLYIFSNSVSVSNNSGITYIQVCGSPSITGNTAETIYFASGTPLVTGNTLTGELPLSFGDLDDVDRSEISGNTYDHANAYFAIGGMVNGNQTLGFVDGRGKYVTNWTMTIAAEATLLIASGVEVSVPPGPGGGSTIEVYGVLNAAGANLHGVVSTWGNQQLAIVVRSGGEADLSECTLSLAALQYDSGSTGRICTSVIVSSSIYLFSSEVIITRSSFQGCSTGIYLSDASSLITFNDFSQCNTAIYVAGDSNPSILFNRFYDNSCALSNQGFYVLSCPYNWWGDDSGPQHPDNPGGTGDIIIGEVDFLNWVGGPVSKEVSYGVKNFSPMSNDPVNTATGNFTYELEDLFIKGIGINFVFGRSYNSQSGLDGPLGYGWSHTYQMTITIGGDGAATIRYADGHEQKFLPNGSGGFVAPPDAFDTLVNNGDGTYSLTTRDQISYRLSGTTGKLISVEDLNGNTILLAYDGSGDLDYITDTMGRTIDVTCDASHRIIQLSDPIGRTIVFQYDANGDLVKATGARGHFEEYTYDSQHQILSIKDRRGNTKITLTYDTNKVVTSQRDAYSSSTSYVYDTVNRVTTINDAYGKIYHQYYDANFRLIKEVDPLGKFAEYTYDAKGNRTSVKDKLGRLTSFQYDERGNVIKKTDPLGHSVLAEYNALNLPTLKVDELGYEATLTYDAKGNLLSVKNAMGNSIVYTYNSKGQKLTETDPLLNVTLYNYDVAGNLEQITNELGGETNYTYDPIGRLLSVTDPLGRVTSFTNDENDNQETVTNALLQVTTSTFDENDNLLSITNPLSQTANYTYDLKNRLIQVTDPLGNQVIYTYDKLDRKTCETDPLGSSTEFGYDELGNLLTVTDPLGNTAQYTYDANGRKISMTDARGNVTGYEYDEMGRLKEVTDAAGGITLAVYDARGSLLQVTDPMGRVTSYEYDSLGRLIKETDPLLNNTLYTYDANGNLDTKTDANGVVSDYTYDELNRLTQIAYTGGEVTLYSYDAVGNRLTMADTAGTTTYTYDNLNRPLTVQDAYGKTVGYQYDSAGRRTKIIYPGNKEVTYGYDDAGRLISVVDWLSTETSFSYDAAGRLLGQVNGNGTTMARQYDTGGRLTNLQNKKSGGAVITSHSFTLDKVGNRTRVSESLPLSPTSPNQNLTFSHNAGHQVISDGIRSYTYDNNGNRISANDGATLVAYSYNAKNRLTEMQDGTRVDTYRYNGDGTLVSAVRNGTETRYVLDTAATMPNILTETDSAGNFHCYHIHGNGLLYSISASDNRYSYYHYDAIGSTLALTGSTQVVTDKYANGPYGETGGSSGTTPNRFRYVGQFGVMQEDNGLMFMRARFYDPLTKRFIGMDPVRGEMIDPMTLNPFIYAKGNPLLFLDPTGLVQWLRVGWGVVTLGASVASAAGFGALGVSTSWTGVGAVVGAVGIGLSISAAYESWGEIIAGFREDPAEQHTMAEDVAGLIYVKSAGSNATESGLADVQNKTGKVEFGANIVCNSYKGAAESLGRHAGSNYAPLWGVWGSAKEVTQGALLDEGTWAARNYYAEQDKSRSSTTLYPELINLDMKMSTPFKRGKI
jgi:RHS repeat-associated protein